MVGGSGRWIIDCKTSMQHLLEPDWAAVSALANRDPCHRGGPNTPLHHCSGTGVATPLAPRGKTGGSLVPQYDGGCCGHCSEPHVRP